MSYLLDTNVVSEWTKVRPHAGVVSWLHEVDEDRVFLSVITLAELRYGVDRLPTGTRRGILDAWLANELPLRFESRILPIDSAVADASGRLTAQAEARGRTLSAMDALIAGTAVVHGLTVVTRDTGDFEIAVKSVLNPWS